MNNVKFCMFMFEDRILTDLKTETLITQWSSDGQTTHLYITVQQSWLLLYTAFMNSCDCLRSGTSKLADTQRGCRVLLCRKIKANNKQAQMLSRLQL